MSLTIQLHVPAELKFALFFSEQSVTIDVNELKLWKKPYTFTQFPYDLAFFQGIEAYQPWIYAEKHVPVLLTEWKAIELECQTLFSERKAKMTLEPMKEGIALFFMLLYWIHKKPVEVAGWERKVNELPIKPVNVVERLAFVVRRPTLYHSFIQLSELFHELEKHYVKSTIKKSPRLH